MTGQGYTRAESRARAVPDVVRDGGRGMTDLHAEVYVPPVSEATAWLRSLDPEHRPYSAVGVILAALEDRRRLRGDVSAAVSGWIRGGDPEEAMRLVARAVTVSARVDEDEKEN